MLSDDILRIAQAHLKNVKRSGPENIMATCPFHTMGARITKTFTMSLTRGLYFCFSCQAAGSLRHFLEGMNVPSYTIDQRYKYALEEVDKYRPTPVTSLKEVFEQEPLDESILGLFDKCPLLLLDEGFEEDVLRDYDIGFDDSTMRITFPLRRLDGKLMGISGRSVTGEEPRYKIYDYEFTKWGLPKLETKRNSLLWNAHRVYANLTVTPREPIIVVEGFKAALWLIQHGYPNTVALVGSYMSKQQQMLIERFGTTTYVMLDNDDAGKKGRAYVGSRLSRSLNVRMVDFTEEKKQPSDLTRDELDTALGEAKDFFLWDVEPYLDPAY